MECRGFRGEYCGVYLLVLRYYLQGNRGLLGLFSGYWVYRDSLATYSLSMEQSRVGNVDLPYTLGYVKGIVEGSLVW